MRSGSTSPPVPASGDPSLPNATLLARQADWLAPARAQLLRRVHVARRERVLDLGAGHGAVIPELVRRSGGEVVALDRDFGALQQDTAFVGAQRCTGDAVALPFASGTLDLIFSQLTLLWIGALHQAIIEIWRTLKPGGVLVALEPDYGGMIEYPPELSSRELWIRVLARAGADPLVARKLPGLLSAQGFEVQVALFDTLFPPDPDRFLFLYDLPMTEAEHQQLDTLHRLAHTHTGVWDQVAHLPFFLIRATKPTDHA